jgi:hypothetical protein
MRRCANVYLNIPMQYSIAYHTLGLYGKAYCSWAKNPHSMLLCWILWTIVTIGVCYNIIILWDRRGLCGPLWAETSLCSVYLYLKMDGNSHSVKSSAQNKYPCLRPQIPLKKVVKDVRLLEINWKVHSLVQNLRWQVVCFKRQVRHVSKHPETNSVSR